MYLNSLCVSHYLCIIGSVFCVLVVVFYWCTCSSACAKNKGKINQNKKSLINRGTVFSVVTARSSSIWIPGNNICIDKGMIPFREKVHFKVHKPDEYKI